MSNTEELMEFLEDCFHSIDARSIAYESRQAKKEVLIRDFKSSWCKHAVPKIEEAAYKGYNYIDLLCGEEYIKGFSAIAEFLGYNIKKVGADYISLSW